MKSKRKNKEEQGTTILALAITIIVLLILAGITVSAITGDNGIIKNAGQAKEETEIANEKEIVEKATIQAMGNNKYGNIEESELQSELDKETGEGKTEATDIGDEFEVVFIDSNRYYTVDKDGNVGEGQEIIKDKNPGDITTEKDGETLDGSEEHPYEIWCIEDLIEWSQNYTKYQNNHIILCKDLNFKSRLSYADSENTSYGDINEDDKIESLIEEMQIGIGFTPISNFTGTFNGQGYEIRNVYVNTTEGNVGGLFKAIGVPTIITTIKNITVTGDITGTSSVGGIIGATNNVNNTGKVIIENCVNKCTVNYNLNPSNIVIIGIGGILGENSLANTTDTVQIINCHNYGTINSSSENSYSGIGGIAGCDYYNGLIINECYNAGTINGKENNTAGIIGRGGNSIYNSYNSGEVKGSGIGGHNCANIYNCYNIGNVTLSGIVRGDYLGSVVINNVYTTSSIKSKPIVHEYISNATISNVFYSDECIYTDTYGTKISEKDMKGTVENKNSLISLLNRYVENYNLENKNEKNFIELNYWELDGNTGYPKLKY